MCQLLPQRSLQTDQPQHRHHALWLRHVAKSMCNCALTLSLGTTQVTPAWKSPKTSSMSAACTSLSNSRAWLSGACRAAAAVSNVGAALLAPPAAAASAAGTRTASMMCPTAWPDWMLASVSEALPPACDRICWLALQQPADRHCMRQSGHTHRLRLSPCLQHVPESWVQQVCSSKVCRGATCCELCRKTEAAECLSPGLLVSCQGLQMAQPMTAPTTHPMLMRPPAAVVRVTPSCSCP
jgi:hypothetical protein